MDHDEKSLQMLVNMGFSDITEIKRALRLGNNDVNDAVAILTQERSGMSYDVPTEAEMREMKGLGKGGTEDMDIRHAPDPPPPSYDEAVEPIPVENEDMSSVSNTDMKDTEENTKEFPATNLYELEGRVFTDQWSIPYKKEESLGKCLLAAIRLAEDETMEEDDSCMRFVSRCMPEAFKKLMTSTAVHRWGAEIHEGIYNMLQLAVELIAIRLKYIPVPLELLELLTTIFNPDTEFHYKNRNKQWERIHWENTFGTNNTYAVTPPAVTYKEPCGWLVNLINRFAEKGGIDWIRIRILDSSMELSPSTMATLLKPLGACSDYLNALRITTYLSEMEKRIIKYIQELKDNDLKQKKAGSISDILCNLKSMIMNFWIEDMTLVDDLRLHLALRMLKSLHFNARMNSLKEIIKLIEDSTSSSQSKHAIEEKILLNWLVEEKVLSIALEGNIDQTQYCDKLKGIVEFLGSKLSAEELTKIWKMQNDQPLTVVDNIHSIMAAAAVRFNDEQLEHLILLIQKAWKGENDRVQEKLLTLIGRIGKDTRDIKTTCKVLELLWDLSHLPGIPTMHLEHALEEHMNILSNSIAASQQVKSKYVTKCVEDIKKGQLVVPAIRQLHLIAKGFTKHTYSKHDKSIVQELNKTHDIIKLLTQSLLKCHKMAVNTGGGCTIANNPKVDGRYTHNEHVDAHLKFLAFILEQGHLYLPWSQAKEIWDCLVSSPEACNSDKEKCYLWFNRGLSDLENDTQLQLFREKILKIDPCNLSCSGFDCVKAFFESININNQKLKKQGNSMIVERLDLTGMEFMWQIALETPSEDIAEVAINQIMRMSYTNLSLKLKKDQVALHKRFLAECSRRLELASITMGGTALAIAISQATRIATAATIPEVSSIPSPSRSAKYLVIERLLQLATVYITTVEDQNQTPRTIQPHGASFQGPPITLRVSCESPKTDFTCVSHANEILHSVRKKIAVRMKTTIDNIHLSTGEKMLLTSKDNKLLRQLSIEEEQIINVKLLGGAQGSRTEEGAAASTGRQPSELERMLPGAVMAAGGQVFELLYQLAELEEPKITEKVRKLLMLIPTDSSVQDALDSITRCEQEDSSQEGDSTHSGDSGGSDTSRVTLEGLFKSTAHGMSSFRLLYNLEVLSSRLMPSVQEDVGTQSSAQSFREIFLSAGGLSLVTNVLQKDSIPQDVDLETRRGCYSIALQLARFLLCGQTSTALMESDLSMIDEVFNSSLDSSVNLSSSFSSSPRKVLSLVERMSSVEASGDTVSKEGTTKARYVIQTMSTQDFTSMVSCLMRVVWSAAAGHLRLASANQPIKESPSVGTSAFSSTFGRSRHSSTGSNASSSSVDSEPQFLHPGVCLKTRTVCAKDAMIAREALELMVACLQLRPHNLNSLYHLIGVGDFIVEVLLYSPHTDIRIAALEQFYTLSQTDVNPEVVKTIHPRHFILQILLKTPVPLWTASSLVRGANSRILGQCSQYFDLRCRLLEGLSVKDQKFLNINPMSMVQDELDWLQSFEPCDPVEALSPEVDNTMLAGHLKLARMLLTCEGVNKDKFGKLIISRLLSVYMFPASQLILKRGTNEYKVDKHTSLNPKIFEREARIAAYELLITLAEKSPENLRIISDNLVHMHHEVDPSLTREWEYMPPVDGRSCKFVGLKNGGATCYMNSVIQQLYMTPGIREGILSAKNSAHDDDSLFFQIQMVLGHLWESQLQYYEPERFWRVFKFWGEPVNIREQQDAFDFFTILTDQLDEYLKKHNQKEVFKPKFQGVFLNQMICQDCPHRKEREEEFFALNLTVKSQNLEASLEQFVRGEMLEGENAYLCEDCNEKRNTIKRTCIKKIPPVLVIQLKRFGYDWEAGRALKFDDYFKFPWVLDMEPYTARGVKRRDLEAQASSEDDSDEDTKKNVAVQSTQSELYQLVGIVVHSGQANAGHYYSFIKDRWGSSISNASKGKWFKFNDTIVEEFEMSDYALEAECFGGNYRPKNYDSSAPYPTETRARFWSGYMLFYERMEEMLSPEPFRGSLGRAALLKQDSEGEIHMLEPISSPELSPRHDGDRLSELSALVNRGERKGLFGDYMPPGIQRVIRDENLQFLRDRAIYNMEYFNFIRTISSCNLINCLHEHFELMSVISMQLSFQFLFNTYFRTNKKLRFELGEWCGCVENLARHSKKACSWALQYFGNEGRENIVPYLLECPTGEVRVAFARILQAILHSHINHHSNTDSEDLNRLVEYLLCLLEKDVPDHCKRCSQYFWLFSTYLETDVMCCKHLFEKGGFHKMMSFLLGRPLDTAKQMDMYSRRWSSLYTREFGSLHLILAAMIIHCDVIPYRTTDTGEFAERKAGIVLPSMKEPLAMPQDMQEILYGPGCLRYIRECVYAFREVTAGSQAIVEMVLHCSFCNEGFTLSVMMLIQYQVESAPANELKPVLELLLELLEVQDPLQKWRVTLAVEGNNDNGLLGIIKKCTNSDSSRCYRCIKFLVVLASKCPVAKDYLMSIAPKWQWSVQWLKKKMSDLYWSSNSSTSNESSLGKGFQRTMSAQDTLEEATALLTGLTTKDDLDDDEEPFKSDDQEGSEVNTSTEQGDEKEEGGNKSKTNDEIDD